jgi:hypothetical protein
MLSGPITDVTVFLLCARNGESLLETARYSELNNHDGIVTAEQRVVYRPFGVVRDGKWFIVARDVECCCDSETARRHVPGVWRDLILQCTEPPNDPHFTVFPLVYEADVRECLRRVKEDGEWQYLEFLVNHLRMAWRRALVGRVLAVEDPDVRLYEAELGRRFADYPLLISSSPQQSKKKRTAHTPSELLYIVRKSGKIISVMAEMERECTVFSGFPRGTNGAAWLRHGPAPESIRGACVAYAESVVRDARVLLRAIADANFDIVRLIHALVRVAEDRGFLHHTDHLLLVYHVSLRWQFMRELHLELERRCERRGMPAPSAITIVQEYCVWERGFVQWRRRNYTDYSNYADPMRLLHALGTDGSRESVGGFGGGPAGAVKYKTSAGNFTWSAAITPKARREKAIAEILYGVDGCGGGGGDGDENPKKAKRTKKK